jgi:hypothetical protein
LLIKKSSLYHQLYVLKTRVEWVDFM